MLPITVRTAELPLLDFRATLIPSTINTNARTVDVIWTTGAPVLRGYYDKFYEELSLDPRHVRMGRLNNGAPLLDSHDSYSTDGMRGVVEPGTAKLEAKRGVATVRFTKDDPPSERAFRMVQDGILVNVSVGYRVHKFEKIEDVENKIPTYRAIDWEPYEISLVPMGADDGAGTRSADALKTNPCEFITRAQETDDMTEEERAAAAAEEQRIADLANAEQQRAAAATAGAAGTVTPPVDVAAVVERTMREGRTAERARAAGIRNAVKQANLDPSVADRMIERDVTLDAARGEVLDLLAARDAATGSTGALEAIPGGAAEDKYLRGATNALLIRGGVNIADLARAEGRPVADYAPGEFRSLSILDLARGALDHAHVNYRGLDRDSVIGLAHTQPGRFAGRGVIQIDGRAVITQSTSDLGVLLENVMHKSMRAVLPILVDTWRKFCAVGSVSDFRDWISYEAGSFSDLDLVAENAEYKDKPLTDGIHFRRRVYTWGNMINWSRQMAVNDDIGALTGNTQKLTRAAYRTIENRFYAILKTAAFAGPTMEDSLTLFHATHGNVATGTAPSVAAFDADINQMASQLDQSGNDFVDIVPDRILAPLSLRGAIATIFAAEYDLSQTVANQAPNIVRNRISPENIVGTPRLTGNRRYLFADPNVYPSIQVDFLDGQQVPLIRTQDGWRQDGAEMKITFDFGVNPVGWRGVQTNPGP